MEHQHDEASRGGLSRRRMLGVLGGAGVALATGTAARRAAGDPDCKVITGTQEDVLVSEGCASPIGFCARGTFQGNHGFQGASAFTGLAFDPVPNDPLGRLAVSGESTYTTSDGQITVSDVSAFDTVRGT